MYKENGGGGILNRNGKINVLKNKNINISDNSFKTSCIFNIMY